MPALAPTPTLNNRNLTVELALKQPTRIETRIAVLTDEHILVDKFFTGLAAPIQGGGLLYSVLKASDFYTSDVRQRGPGDEYELVRGVDPEARLAKPEDWGGKFWMTDEQIRRNDVSYFDQEVSQLANTIAKKLDARCMEVVAAAMTGENTIAGHNWMNQVFVGPENTLTPGSQRPSADLAVAQLASSMQELGVQHDTLVVHPTEAANLRIAYEANLDAMLRAAGITKMFENPRVTAGTAWVLQRGSFGRVGFEWPLTVETWREKETRRTFVQAYACPAFAVEKPYGAKKITGVGA